VLELRDWADSRVFQSERIPRRCSGYWRIGTGIAYGALQLFRRWNDH
jgi:hypothetical protein